MRASRLAAALVLSGCGHEAPAPRACERSPAITESVSITNAYGALEGTVEVPETCGPSQVVLFMSGSGSQDRDGNDPFGNSTDMFSLLAAGLKSAGVASLRYDDHGVGGSTRADPPSLEDFTFELEVTDAARWLTWLRADERFSQVLAAGHSQGSLTAMLAFAIEPFDGYISLAGAGKPAGQLLIEQISDDLSTAQVEDLRAAVAVLEAGGLPGPLAAPLNQVMPVEIQPYLRSWFAYDPAVEIAAISAPTLIAHGTTDWTVDVTHAGLLSAAKPDAQVLIVDDMAHTLKSAGDDRWEQRAAYTDPSLPIAAPLRVGLQAFLNDVAGER